MSTIPCSADHERLLRLVDVEFSVDRGTPLPLGSTVVRGGVNIAVFSRHATAMTLVLFEPGGREPLLELPLDPGFHRTGDVWHTYLRGLDLPPLVERLNSALGTAHAALSRGLAAGG